MPPGWSYIFKAPSGTDNLFVFLSRNFWCCVRILQKVLYYLQLELRERATDNYLVTWSSSPARVSGARSMSNSLPCSGKPMWCPCGEVTSPLDRPCCMLVSVSFCVSLQQVRQAVSVTTLCTGDWDIFDFLFLFLIEVLFCFPVQGHSPSWWAR